VLDRSKDQRVVMLNESHNDPSHRAFLYSLLDDFYKMGFRYLALEALSNRKGVDLKSVSSDLGWYLKEPVAGELARHALELGFTLYPYEDTVTSGHTALHRDSAQAENLASLLKNNPSSKVIVLGGYGHISEESFSDGYQPMAARFKKITGIDPLTVDQAQMSESCYFIYGKTFYDGFISKFPVSAPAVFLKKGKAVNLLENTGYDIIVVHPPTKFVNGRATWYNLNGARVSYGVKPTEKDLFLVQAIYPNEASANGNENSVPADQTYLSGDDGYYYLYLKPGKYRLVMRDMDYNLLSQKDIEVK
jgi:hypothetical protein